MLIMCPECGKDISDKAKSCIHCGYTTSITLVSNQNKHENDCAQNISPNREKYENTSLFYNLMTKLNNKTNITMCVITVLLHAIIFVFYVFEQDETTKIKNSITNLSESYVQLEIFTEKRENWNEYSKDSLSELDRNIESQTLIIKNKVNRLINDMNNLSEKQIEQLIKDIKDENTLNEKVLEIWSSSPEK